MHQHLGGWAARCLCRFYPGGPIACERGAFQRFALAGNGFGVALVIQDGKGSGFMIGTNPFDPPPFSPSIHGLLALRKSIFQPLHFIQFGLFAYPIAQPGFFLAILFRSGL